MEIRALIPFHFDHGVDVAESVSNSANGLDYIRFGAQFAPQRSDMDIDRALQDDRIVTQRGIDQLGSTKCPPLISHQDFQETEFALRER